MKREIKFRGKYSRQSKYAGQWVYGNLVVPEEIQGDEVMIVKALSDDASCTYHVDVNSVGQFTGLTDKNGKEIYEGDIVQWDECVADYTFVTQSSEVFYDDRSASFMPFGEWHSSDFEIIGNVFDNPELLEE